MTKYIVSGTDQFGNPIEEVVEIPAWYPAKRKVRMAENSVKAACSNCDFGRKVGVELNCWYGPPESLFLGIDPVTQRRIIVPMMRPTWPDYHCHEWMPQAPDHPDLVAPAEVPLPTHEEPDRAQ